MVQWIQGQNSGARIANGLGSVVVNADGSINAGGGGGASVPALTLTPPATSLSVLDIHTHESGLVAALRIWDDNANPANWNPKTVIGPSGNITTNAWVTINGNASQPYGSPNITTDPYMLGVCNDVAGGVIIAAGATAGNYALGILAANQSLAAAGSYTMMVTPDGTIHWGPGTAAGTLATMDTALHRVGVGILKTDGAFQAGGNIDSLGASQGLHIVTSSTWVGPAILSDSTQRLVINPGGNPTTFGNNGGTMALLAVRGNGTTPVLNVEGVTAGTYFLFVTNTGNVGMGTNGQFGNGTGVLGVANAGTVPSVTPTGGGVLYASGGALHWRGSSGTDTVVAVA